MPLRWIRLSIALLVLIISAQMMAQGGLQRNIVLRPVYQNWSFDGDSGSVFQDFSEFSMVLSAQVPLNDRFSLSFWGAQAETNGDIADISGLADVQITSHIMVPEMKSVFSLAVNLPSGRTEFTTEQLESSLILGDAAYRLQVPNFGQGLNVAPGFIIAHDVNHQFALGAGATFKYNGAYNPVDFLGEFDPGDEFTVTAGAEYRLNENTSLKGDIIFTAFQADKLADTEIFDAGSKTVFIVDYLQNIGNNTFNVFTRYRSRANSLVLSTNQETQTIPNNFDVFTSYSMKLPRATTLKFLLEGRFYNELETAIANNLSGGNLFGFGIRPSARFGEAFAGYLQAKYYTGSFSDDRSLSGYDIGVGLILYY